MNDRMTHRIVVLGAGYAGLGATTRLARSLRGADVDVILVDRSDRFTERVRLHQLAAGQDLPIHRLAHVLADTGVDLVMATVAGVDLEARTVHLDAAPHTLSYDTLVYALGSGADLDTVPGVRDHAFAVADIGQAERLRAHLGTTRAGGRLVVVGGGLTGIEAATELAEARPDLHVDLVSGPPVGGWLSSRAQHHLYRTLDRMGVMVHQGRHVTTVGVDTVSFNDGGTLSADTVVWAAGFAVPALASQAGLAVDTRGRMHVDDRLRSISHPQVYGIGDAAAAPTSDGTQTRMSCQTGLPMGQYVARTIAHTMAGHEPAPIRIRYVWQNISLGRRDGVTQFTRSDDRPRGLVLTGRTSARFKEAITRSAAWSARR